MAERWSGKRVAIAVVRWLTAPVRVNGEEAHQTSQAVSVLLSNRGHNIIHVNALLDDGSSCTIITEQVKRWLWLGRLSFQFTFSSVDGTSVTRLSWEVKDTLENRDRSFRREISAYTMGELLAGNPGMGWHG